MTRTTADRGLFEQRPTGRDRTRATFEAFHAKHPQIFELFLRFALEARDAGHERYSARTIVERIRWECQVARRWRGDEFAINDHVAPHYARLAMERHPRLRGFFETRERQDG